MYNRGMPATSAANQHEPRPTMSIYTNDPASDWDTHCEIMERSPQEKEHCSLCCQDLDADELAEAVEVDGLWQCETCNAELAAEGFDIFEFIE